MRQSGVMGGASKSLMLLSAPFPLLCPRPSPTRLVRRSQAPPTSLSFPVSGAQHRVSAFSSHPLHGFPLRAAEVAHGQQTGVGEERAPDCGVSTRPWPEWVKLVEHAAASGYADRWVSPAHGGEDDDSFSASEELPEGFAEAAAACLVFARLRPDLLRLLPRRDIEVLVENGSPFLFKSALDSVRRMKSFISGDGSNVLGSEQAYTIDVVRYLLSYVCNSLGAAGGDDTKRREPIEASVRSLLRELVNVDVAVREQNATELAAGHTPFRYEQHQRHAEQKIEMKRGDWICPKCSFMNFARNMKCLECSEARPKRQLTGEEWECPQCDFFNYGKNIVCLRCDCKRPGEISALERRLGISQYRDNSGNEDSVHGSDSVGGTESDKMSESAISQRLDRILNRSSAASGANDTGRQSVIGNAGIKSGGRFTSPERRDSGYVPFVPLPPDMFREKPTEVQQSSLKEDANHFRAELTETLSGGSGLEKSEKAAYSEDLSSLPLAKANEESSDLSARLSRKAVQLPEENNMPSALSDDDFPEIMPMRKGENRFVISKKKDRSLTSPQYKRHIAMEQANNSNFVPFVPFPPGYFAKDKQPEDGSITDKSAAETCASAVAGDVQSMSQKLEENVIGEANQGGSSKIQIDSPKTNGNRGGPAIAQITENLGNKNAGSFNSGSFQEGRASVSASGRLNQQVENPQNETDNRSWGFSGKSLEGSAVTEPDPLDMSEEAKAQRWFRRVAQINDISELSKIPDEDFPEIMPMRKGVNRFVVSKRKTPLERRLTSPQYRRNLPIVRSDPEKDSS